LLGAKNSTQVKKLITFTTGPEARAARRHSGRTDAHRSTDMRRIEVIDPVRGVVGTRFEGM
jgi:hypothetical protein